MSRFYDEICERAKISDIIKRYIKLNKKGREWHGLCPFHKEKTPSFTVNDEKEFYHCFGCGAHGNVINFVEKQEGLTFREASEKLAGEFGIPIPQYKQKTEEEEKKEVSLYEIMEKATTYFENNLKGKELNYLLERGITKDTIKKFKLGFAPTSKIIAIDKKQAIEAGLSRQNENGTTYDYFRNRIIFPILNRKGQTVAFGGRGITNDIMPKYLNSPETDIFHKSSTLYGLNLARKSIYDKGQVIITEGYIDVIAMHQAGFENTVAPLGTAVTTKHIDLLWNLADEPIFCLDGDVAGIKAMHRVAYMALEKLKSGKSIRFAFLPKGYDPDDLIKEKGRGAIEEVISRAVPLVDILWEIESSKITSNTPEQRAAFETRIMKIANSINDYTVKKYYSDIFKSKLWEGRKNKSASYFVSSRSVQITKVKNQQEARILYMIISNPDLLHYKDVEEKLVHINSSDSNFIKIANLIMTGEYKLEGEDIKKAELYKVDSSIEEIYQDWIAYIEKTKELDAGIEEEFSNIKDDNFENSYKLIEEMINKKLSS